MEQKVLPISEKMMKELLFEFEKKESKELKSFQKLLEQMNHRSMNQEIVTKGIFKKVWTRKKTIILTKLDIRTTTVVLPPDVYICPLRKKGTVKCTYLLA